MQNQSSVADNERYDIFDIELSFKSTCNLSIEDLNSRGTILVGQKLPPQSMESVTLKMVMKGSYHGGIRLDGDIIFVKEVLYLVLLTLKHMDSSRSYCQVEFTVPTPLSLLILDPNTLELGETDMEEISALYISFTAEIKINPTYQQLGFKAVARKIIQQFLKGRIIQESEFQLQAYGKSIYGWQIYATLLSEWNRHSIQITLYSDEKEFLELLYKEIEQEFN